MQPFRSSDARRCLDRQLKFQAALAQRNRWDRAIIKWALGLTLAVSPGLTAFGGQAGTDKSGPASKATPQPAADSKSDAPSRDFQLRVVGPDGKPVSKAEVEIRTSPRPKARQITRGRFLRVSTYGLFAETDDEGQLNLQLVDNPERFTVSIKQPGYGPYWGSWDSSSHREVIPREFTAELDAAWSVGGVLVDDAGQPVNGAEVHPSIEYKKRPGVHEQLGIGTRIRSDKQGRWRFDCVPVSMPQVSVSFSHRDFQPLRRNLPRVDFEIQGDASPAARIKLDRGLTVAGTVTDESGQPIKGALVRTQFLNDIRQARTDAQGVYHLSGCEPRMARIVVSAKGRATDVQEVLVGPNMAPVDFQMKPGGKIRVRVVDEQGHGIARARIFFQEWRGSFNYFEFDNVNQYADKNGVWEWNEAPLDTFQADICRPGGMQLSRQALFPREEEFVFTPPSALVVSGSVIDAKTKAPIQKFRVIPALRNTDSRVSLIERDRFEATDGKYRVRMTHGYPAHLVRIEADGYRVAISRDIATDEGEVRYDFELQPAANIAATVVTSDGKAAEGAKIAVGVAGSQISIDRGDIDDTSTYSAARTEADANGRFSLPARGEPFQLVITHAAGFAYLNASDDEPLADPIELTPWARLEGTYRVGAQPARGVTLTLNNNGIQSYGETLSNIFTRHEVTTDENGHFVFERVFPGSGRIGRRIVLMVNDGATETASSLQVYAEFTAGETTTLELGGAGRAVIGKLVVRNKPAADVLWNFATVNLQADLVAPPIPPVPPAVQNDPVKRQAWWNEWRVTDAGLAWTAAYDVHEQMRQKAPYLYATVARDGSFRMDDVPEGNFVLSVMFSREAPGILRDYRLTVPPVQDGATTQPLDLGVLTLEQQ